MNFLINHWAELALALITLLSTLTALTESTRDDKIVAVLSRVLNAIIFGRTKTRQKKGK